MIKAGGPYYLWHPDKDMHFAAVPRNGTAKDIKWFRGPAMGVGHTMNAFRTGNTLHFDATVYNGNMFTFFPVAKSGVVDYPPPSVGDGQTPVPPFLTRLSFDLAGNTSDFARAVALEDAGRDAEDWTIAYQGRPYRHGYLIVRPRMDANRTANLESAVGHIDHRPVPESVGARHESLGARAAVRAARPGRCRKGKGGCSSSSIGSTRTATTWSFSMRRRSRPVRWRRCACRSRCARRFTAAGFRRSRLKMT